MTERGPLVLGIDTATRIASVGVATGERVLGEAHEDNASGHVASLPSIVDRALAAAGVGLDAVDTIAVSVGPGSFTGLRIGLAFAKGVAFARRKRLVAVSTLEALAARAPAGYSVVAVSLDARKGEVYLGIFRRSAEDLVRVRDDEAMPPSQAAALILAAASGERAAVIGDGASAHAEAFATLEASGVHLLGFDVHPPSGATVAALGAGLLRQGQSTAPEALLPVYVRASEAELRAAVPALTVERAVS